VVRMWLLFGLRYQVDIASCHFLCTSCVTAMLVSIRPMSVASWISPVRRWSFALISFASLGLLFLPAAVQHRPRISWPLLPIPQPARHHRPQPEWKWRGSCHQGQAKL